MPHLVDDILPHATKDALSHLALGARLRVASAFHGQHQSRRVGISTDFDHHKVYAPGDPIKHVDWKASARLGRLYVKRYLEDTLLSLRVVVDRSASMRQATAGAVKYREACRLAAALCYVVTKEGDAAGLVFACAQGFPEIPPGSSRSHLIRILEALADSGAAAEDRMESCLRGLADRGGRRGLIAVVSDLMFDPRPVRREMGRLLAQGHEVLVFQVRDATEEDFPFNRWVEFRDLEHAGVRRRIDTVPLKALYRSEYAALVNEWESWTRRHGVHMVSFRAGTPVQTVVSDYLAWRARMG